ncbi:MAG: hypothetical protein R2939_07940 [Kofleriaceae bacterium]
MSSRLSCAVSLALVLGTTGVAAPTARAEAPACDPAEAARVRALVDEQADRARTWNLAWGAVYGLAAAGEFTLVVTEFNPIGTFDDDFRAGALVGGLKASIGFASKLVLPMRIPRPAPLTGDACADLAAAERTLALASRRQRNGFFLNHFGGLAVNGAGALLLGLYYDTWTQAAISVGIGLAVGVASSYTAPRGAWKAHRRRARGATLVAAPLVGPGTAGAMLGVAF